MTRLILARHGNTFERDQTPIQIGLKTDLPLTFHGFKQAEMVANFLRESHITPDVFYSGKLKRQRQFGKVVADQFAKPLLFERLLNEIDYGPWEGLTAEEISQKWPQEFVDWNEKGSWPSFFSEDQLARKTAIESWIRSLPPSSTVFAVTSNGILRLLKEEKVKTGHVCQIDLEKEKILIKSWNTNPQAASLKL